MTPKLTLDKNKLNIKRNISVQFKSELARHDLLKIPIPGSLTDPIREKSDLQPVAAVAER
jgi:hypothetical protein